MDVPTIMMLEFDLLVRDFICAGLVGNICLCELVEPYILECPDFAFSFGGRRRGAILGVCASCRCPLLSADSSGCSFPWCG